MSEKARVVGLAHNILCIELDGRREHYNLAKTVWLQHCNCRQSSRRKETTMQDEFIRLKRDLIETWREDVKVAVQSSHRNSSKGELIIALGRLRGVIDSINKALEPPMVSAKDQTL